MDRKVIMPFLVGEKISDNWYVEFGVFNEKSGEIKRFRKSKGFADRKTVEEKRAYGLKQVVYWEARLRDLQYDPFKNNLVVLTDNLEYRINPNKVKVSQYNILYFTNLFFETRKSELRSKTYSTYMVKARILDSWLNEQKLGNIHPKYFSFDNANEFSDYLLRKRKVHNRSHNAYIQTLHTIWEFLKKKKVVDVNVWALIDKRRYNSESQKPFTPDQSLKIREFLQTVNPWLLFFCEFQYHTLIRPCSEQPFIKISDIDYYTQELTIRGEISKNKKTQRVAIPDPLMERIRHFQILDQPGDYFIFGRYGPSPDPIGKDYFSKMFRGILTQLGIGKGWSMYSWKHTMNQRAAMNGIPVKELQIQNRHHSLDQMDTYLKGLTVRDAKNLFKNIPEM